MQKTSTPLGSMTLLFAAILVIVGMVISVVALSAGGWTLLAFVYAITMTCLAGAAAVFGRV